MRVPKLLVIHGAGMNMRGKVQLDIFGHMLLPEYDEHIRKYAAEHGFEVEIFHSNIEVILRFFLARFPFPCFCFVTIDYYNDQPYCF